ncbi:RNA polymerase sigma factor [Rubripirellula obstinata]|uniref:RNA polymerase sigma factor n=2 Tax=Rubripirellula obstinata TaxID=406547 RepID=A0A5B1CJI0_9BACT|nr:RNA polymerase sigma factor [Rubripirellula obstinata]
MIDDVTAEVFTTLLARDAAVLRSFQGRCTLQTYLAVIATRVSRRVIAQIVSRETKQTDAIDDLTNFNESVDAEQRIIDQEEIQRLLTLVDRLPPRQRELVVAFYQQGDTYAEISQRTGIPIGSIGTTLRRAEQRLRQWITDESP